MLFGERERFGIEVGEVEFADDKPVSQFRIWMTKEPLGDWDDRIFLKGSLAYANLFIKLRRFREQINCSEADSRTVFDDFYEYYYSDEYEGTAFAHGYDMRDLFHLDDIFMSSLRDRFGIILIPDCSGEMRLICKKFLDGSVREQRLERGELEQILGAYVSSYPTSWLSGENKSMQSE